MSMEYYGELGSKGKAVVVCDKCKTEGAETTVKTGGVHAAVEVFRAAGWKIQKKSGKWTHICPVCAG